MSSKTLQGPALVCFPLPRCQNDLQLLPLRVCNKANRFALLSGNPHRATTCGSECSVELCRDWPRNRPITSVRKSTHGQTHGWMKLAKQSQTRLKSLESPGNLERRGEEEQTHGPAPATSHNLGHVQKPPSKNGQTVMFSKFPVNFKSLNLTLTPAVPLFTHC